MPDGVVTEVVPVPAKAEAARPVANNTENNPNTQVNLRGIAKQAEAGINGIIPPGEVLAGIAGYRYQGMIERNIEATMTSINSLFESGKINKDQADQLTVRIAQVNLAVNKKISPMLENLDQKLEALEKSGRKPDLIIVDLDIHLLQEESKTAEKASDETRVWLLNEDLKKQVAYRRENYKDANGTAPEDQVVKFAQSLSGIKEIPQELTNSPLAYINNFFEKELPKILTNEKARAKLATQLGISTGQVLEMGRTYQSQKKITNDFDKINDDILDYRHPGVKKVKEIGKKSMQFSVILSALMAYTAYKAMKEQEQRGGQGG